MPGRTRVSKKNSPAADKGAKPAEKTEGSGLLSSQQRDMPSQLLKENFFQTIFSMAPEAMLVVDAGLRIIAANHSFSSFADISIEELSVLPLASLLSNSPSPLTDLFEHSSTTFGAVLACRNGRAIPVRCSCSRMQVDTHVFCLLRIGKIESLDVTAVAQQREQLCTILDTAPIGLVFWAGRTLQWCNKRFSAMLGYTPETLPRDRVRSLFVDDFDFTQASQLLGQLSPGNEVSQIEARMLRKDGSEFNALWSRFPVDLPAFAPGFFAAVTEMRLKSSEDALTRAKRKFSYILQDIPLIAITLDQKGNLVFANDFFLALTGWTRDEVLGKNWLEAFVAPSDKKIIRGAFNRSVSEKTLHQVPSYYSRIVTRRGEELMISWYNVPSKNNADQAIEILCLGVDITERQRAEQELLRAKELAEQANKAKNDFLANMSHEVRTPLHGMLGMLQVLEATDLTEEQRKFVRVALSSGQNLTRLLSDILDLPRVEAGTISVAEKPFALQETLRDLEETYLDLAHRKGIGLEVFIDPAIPEQLTGDQLRVRQILHNLVGNAVKFTETGAVGLAAYCRESSTADNFRILFVVSDTGIGIPEHKVDSIFDPFTQMETAYTCQVQGIGLGLQIVKQLVDLLRGEIVVESKVGMGTTFNCILDFKPVPQAAVESESDETAAGVQKGNILLAEDDPVNRIAVQSFLEKKGFSVRCVGNGSDALRSMEKEDYDCVLMDIQMPLMNGVEVTRRIREVKHIGGRSEVPIIALTAYAMEGDEEAFLASGLNGYIAKPVVMSELLKTIETILSAKKT